MSNSRILSLLLTFGMVLAAARAQTTVQGHVFSSNGSPVTGAAVTISPASGAPPAQGTPGQGTYVAISGSAPDAGHYSISGIPAGTYDFKVAYGMHPVQERTGPISGTSLQADFALEGPCDSCPGRPRNPWNKNVLAWITAGVALIFVINIWCVRWNNIARPNRELLAAEIDKVEARFRSETGIDLKPDDPQTAHLCALLKTARAAIQQRFSPWDFLFWSRGQELTGWSRIYEFQRDSVKLLAAGSLPLVVARLQAIQLDLLDINKIHAQTMAANIRDAIAQNPRDEDSLRALLVEALTYWNDENDNTFAQLVAWQTKAVWLVGVGCTLIVVLAFAVGNAVLFIAGAAGGYLSRLARQLKRADVPSDYGASWTTLFLSPIVGALSGWFGILLIVLLADNQLAILGAAFQQIEWYYPLAPLTLGLAFALGFSERLFDGIISSLEEKVDSDRQAAIPTKQPSAALPPPAPAMTPQTQQPQADH